LDEQEIMSEPPVRLSKMTRVTNLRSGIYSCAPNSTDFGGTTFGAGQNRNDWLLFKEDICCTDQKLVAVFLCCKAVALAMTDPSLKAGPNQADRSTVLSSDIAGSKKRAA
jgi:hypothetical protein